MTIIYSTKRIEGLSGIYANPSLFNGDTENCKQVFSDNDEIKKAYFAKGIKVSDLPKVAIKRVVKKTLIDKE